MIWALLTLAVAQPAPGELVDAFGTLAGIDRLSGPAADEARAQAEALLASVYEAAPTQDVLATACEEAGDMTACTALAWRLGFVEGRATGEASDPPQAVELAERACAKGVLRACVAHGQLLQRGAGVRSDPRAAARLFRSACDRGEPRGCALLSKAHQAGLGAELDLVSARSLAHQACLASVPAGCNGEALAFHLGTGGERDLGRALTLYRQACAAGFQPSCNNLGPLYLDGLEGVPDRQSLLEEGCSEGHLTACAPLGDLQRVADAAAAMASYRRSCDAEHGRGCRGVAFLLLDGEVAGDEAEAWAKLEWSCGQGDADACARWGDELASGSRIERDWVKAYEVRAAACRRGHGAACQAAGEQRRKGKGVDKDKADAEVFQQKACARGVLEACP